MLDGQVQLGSRSVSPIYWMAIASLILCLCATCLSTFFPFPMATDTAILFYRQDRWLLLIESGVLLAACVRPGSRKHPLHLPQWALPLIALVLVCVCYAGGKWLLFGYELSRDEQMAVFDARIFSSGLLVQPLPAAWQAHAAALNTWYMLPVAHPIAWISAYLPMNAALRAVVGLVADPALTGPLMVALGLLSLWKCARLLWPEDQEAAIIALLLYLGSGQVLIAGMTAYAMPAHLAFNLMWLWFFLLNRRVADLAALLVAFVATGLHQPLFHPLFAAPILFVLLRERNWPRAALFAVGYGAICAFWLAWPNWMHALVAGPNSTTAAAGTDYFTRLLLALSHGDPTRWQDMAANLLRFFAWQHLLLLPLMVIGAAAAWRERLVGAFASIIILTVGIMLVIMPYQGHGFGYRYLHGAIGVAILLAVYGWRSLVARRDWLRPVFMRATLAGLIVLLPLQAWMARAFYAPFAQLDRRIAASGADYFIAGENDVPCAHDLVINRPDLSNRPIRLIGDYLDNASIRKICRSGARVAMPTSAFLRPIETYYYMVRLEKADARIAHLSPRLMAAGCRVERLDGP